MPGTQAVNRKAGGGSEALKFSGCKAVTTLIAYMAINHTLPKIEEKFPSKELPPAFLYGLIV